MNQKNSCRTIQSFQKAILRKAERRLGRRLSEREMTFIISREGFIALEVVMDTVNNETKEYIEAYLNSE